MSAPVFSVIMPTLNSEKTIRLSLSSIRRQNFDQNLIEILVCDGGSSDQTRKIAQEFHCKVIENPEKLPEWGKFHGLQNARGRYAVFMDSDEELTNADSLKNRLDCLTAPQAPANLLPSGLINPKGYPAINAYLNAIGDPFSYFIYGIAGDDFSHDIPTRYTIESQTTRHAVAYIRPGQPFPIVDGGTHTFDLTLWKEIQGQQKPNILAIPRVFTDMAASTRRLGVMKGDLVNHYSTASFKGYLSKIRWRIENNLFRPAESGVGFANRQDTLPLGVRLKKFLFLPYALSFILPLITGVHLALSRRQPVFLLHPVIAFYTAASILWFTGLKAAGWRPRTKTYG